MIQATLRRLHSPDVQDLASFQPPDPKRVGFLLQILVGPADGEGEESFDAIVCTPYWLTGRYGSEDVLNGLHHIIMMEYDFERLQRFIVSFVSNCRGPTWLEVAQQLGRLGRWEFEDYK